MKALIVEDDYLQAENIRGWLSETWPQLELEPIATEQAFRTWLNNLTSTPPNLVVMDVMLRWMDPHPDASPPPEDVISQGYYRAGIRCVELLLQHPITSNVPIMLYTVLERGDIDVEIFNFPPHVQFLNKGADMARFIQLAGSFIAVTESTASRALLTRDVFICHASEDKLTVVTPLVNALEQAGISVWYDKAEILWGDSLIDKVEEGLRISRYVIAVLSKNFIGKPWPRRELNSALNREASSGDVLVLPLIVGSDSERRDILMECSLQNDKLYEVWTGEPFPILERLKKRLR